MFAAFMKTLLRGLWCQFHSAIAKFGGAVRAKDHPRVWYGGARGGSKAGAHTKLRYLRARFPQHISRFNIVYLFSNARFLSRSALANLKRRNVPILLNQNGVFYPAWHPEGWESRNREMAYAYHAADYVIWQSEFCRQSANKFLGTRKREGKVIYNAVDTQKFTPATSSKSGPKTFLITGNISDDVFYRLELALKAFALALPELQSARLIFAGLLSTKKLQQANRICEALRVEGNVEFQGPYSHDEAPVIYHQADVYVMLKHNDPCPNVVLEAMASGLAIIYSNSGGVPELVGGNAGIALAVEHRFDKVSTPKPEAIAEAMVEIMDGLQTRQANARQRAVANFDIVDWLDQHNILMNDFLGKYGA